MNLFQIFRRNSAAMFLAVCIPTLFISPLHAEVEEYIRDYDYKTEPFDTQTSARIAAIDGLKQELQQELGTYISSVLKIEQNEQGIQNVNRDIVQITAGIISLKLLEEEWRRISYYVKGLMRADSNEVLESVRALREDTQLEDLLRESMNEIEELRAELTRLRDRLVSEQQPDNQQAVQNYRQLVQDIEIENGFQQAMVARLEGDYDRSLELMQKLAEQGHAKAQLRLGQIYKKGIGVDQDYDAALKWFRKAEALNHRDAKAFIGNLYEQGHAVERDPIKALSLYQQSASQGSKQALVLLGLMYRKGDVIKRDHDKAMEYFRRAAERDNGKAIANMGFMYEKGFSVSRDLDTAREYYEQAVGQGNAFAMGRLGNMYRRGLGVTRNPRTAHALIAGSAERGNGFGLVMLGELYENGEGVDQDDDIAFDLYRKSAESGSTRGAFRLGHAYHKEIGVSRDMSAARKWYQKAAEQGHRGARKRLARISGHSMW